MAARTPVRQVTSHSRRALTVERVQLGRQVGQEDPTAPGDGTLGPLVGLAHVEHALDRALASGSRSRQLPPRGSAVAARLAPGRDPGIEAAIEVPGHVVEADEPQLVDRHGLLGGVVDDQADGCVERQQPAHVGGERVAQLHVQRARDVALGECPAIAHVHDVGARRTRGHDVDER